MVPRTQSLNTLIRLTAVALAALLAGCSLNPFAGDDDAAVPTPASAPPQSYDSSAQSRIGKFQNRQFCHNSPAAISGSVR